MYNCGGPDRSIKREDFASGRAISKRYRNRRLGDFLKELKLTEGHSTGLPAMRKAMYQNGSPEPVFDFDEERTWFQVTLPVHVAFEQKQEVILDLEHVKWDWEGIDRLLDEVLEKTGFDEVGSVQAGTIVDFLKLIDNQIVEIKGQLSGTIAGTIADGIVDTLIDTEVKLLSKAEQPVNRENLLKAIGLKNLRHNYDAHVKHLEDKGWLTMTLPHKPTSPNQQYLTTLKGRLLLAFLQHKDR